MSQVTKPRISQQGGNGSIPDTRVGGGREGGREGESEGELHYFVLFVNRSNAAMINLQGA
jgi:hypothetical protein